MKIPYIKKLIVKTVLDLIGCKGKGNKTGGTALKIV